MARNKPLSEVPLSRRGDVATPHFLATKAGKRALAEGGTAVDAAIAAATVLTVVYPHMNAIGGDVHAIVKLPGQDAIAVNGSGAAARAASAEALHQKFGRMPVYGVHAITVPGAVSAWGEMHRLGGSLPWASLFREAIDYAADGVAVAPALARDIAALAGRLSEDRGMRAIFFQPNGQHLRCGGRLIQTRLADSLQQIATEGPQSLYRGDLGARLLWGLQQLGSPLTKQDLHDHSTALLNPISTLFRGMRVLTAPPNTQGFVLLQILRALVTSGLDGDPFGEQAHILARIFALTGDNRERYLADPRFRTVDVDQLLSDEHIGAIVRKAQDLKSSVASEPHGPRPAGDTIAITAMDNAGCAVTVIQSIYHAFGAAILEPETGIICHNRGAAFTTDPTLPSCIVGGARPPSSLTPVLLEAESGLTTAIGTMGGKSQPQILAQHIVRIALGRMPQDALDAPRWVVGTFGASGEEAILLENQVPASVREVLADAGLPLVVGADWDDRVGHSQVVTQGDDGFVSATDRRSDGVSG